VEQRERENERVKVAEEEKDRKGVKGGIGERKELFILRNGRYFSRNLRTIYKPLIRTTIPLCHRLLYSLSHS
jgi:hypothetical protein